MAKVYKFLKIITMAIFIIGSIQSCTKAYTTTDNDNFLENMEILNNKAMFNTAWWTTWEDRGKANLISNIGFAQAVNYSILVTSPSSSFLPDSIIFLMLNENTTTITTNWGGIYGYGYQATLNSNWNGILNSFYVPDLVNADIEYAYTTINIRARNLYLDAGQEYGGSYINAHFEFIPNGEQVTYQDYVDKPYANLQSYSNTWWKLGSITDYADSYRIEGLFKLTGEEENIGTIDFLTENINVNGNNIKKTEDTIYVQSRTLKYNQVYILMLYLYNSDNTLIDSVGYNILFLSLNAKVENGEIIDYGDGSYTIQDSTNAIINNQVSGNQEIINAITNTNISSGDEPTFDDLPKLEVEDVSEDFFTWLLTNIRDIFTDTQEQTLEIELYNNTYTIRSDAIKFTLEPLKTFIQAGWYFIVGVPFLKYIRRTIEKIKGGEIPASDEKSDLLGNVL